MDASSYNSRFIHDVLTGSRSWSATPWDYSSMVYLQFYADNTGIALYGYGQTIYAKIGFRFELVEEGCIKLTYLDSPALGRFKGFVPTESNACKHLEYSMTEKKAIFSESVTGHAYSFQWILNIKSSPFPDGLTFPYEMSHEYHGYREEVSEEKAKPTS